MQNKAFGKRSFDESIHKLGKGVQKYKLWILAIICFSLSLIFLILPSIRKYKNSNTTISFSIRQENGKYIIPPLILSIPKIVTTSGISKFAAAPIKILNFSNNLEIPPGAEVKATLLSGATNGLIKARLTEPLKVDGTSFLDAGTLLMGQGRSTVDRLYVDFKKAVFKDGKSIPISAQAFDGGDSILGLKGSKVGDISLKLAASAGLNFISGMAIGFQDQEYDTTGRAQRPRARYAALSGVSQAASEQAKSSMEEIKNRQPLIEVQKGTVFIVTFDGG